MASDFVMGPEDEVVERLASAAVRDAFERLASAEQKVIALGIFQDLPYRHVAEVLGLPEGTVKSRIRRGLRRLRDLIDVDEDGLRALAPG
jgi:RNA polymerase sigma factor (sigma-70 family)